MVDFALLDIDVVYAIHEEQLAIHGGSPGVRDSGLLESALARPEMKLSYDPDIDCASVAAAYAFGIARNHPFIDGNKRTAFVAMGLCLKLNGLDLIASDAEAVIAMLDVASGQTDENQFADWIRANIASSRKI